MSFWFYFSYIPCGFYHRPPSTLKVSAGASDYDKSACYTPNLVKSSSEHVQSLISSYKIATQQCKMNSTEVCNWKLCLTITVNFLKKIVF